MNKTLLSLLIVLVSSGAFAQKSLSEPDDFIPSKAIYLNFKNKTVSYFIKGEHDDQKELKTNNNLALKGTYSNIYMNWLNPLKYRLTWRDSTYTDERDLAIRNFVGLVTGQFGGSLLPTIGDKAAKSLDAGGTELETTPEKIRTLELLQMYIQIKSILQSDDGKADSLKLISAKELDRINSLLSGLFKLEKMTAYNTRDTLLKSFQILYQVDNPENVKTVCSAEKARVKKVDQTDDIIKIYDDIKTLAAKVEINREEQFAVYIQQVAMLIAERAKSAAEQSKIAINKFNEILSTVEQSVDGTQSDTHKGYFQYRNISFDAGKVLETELVISEYQFEKDKQEFTKKEEVYRTKLKFRRSDHIVVAVSAGIFYSSAKLRSFGLATDGSSLITELEIDKNSAVTATFLNLFFNTGSRYFAPLIQLGVDPTKKNPYLLAGGGFSIPAASFAISGGPIWTWDASLKTLAVGGTVASTTELEKDIEYKFKVKPQGWYLGIQYNF